MKITCATFASPRSAVLAGAVLLGTFVLAAGCTRPADRETASEQRTTTAVTSPDPSDPRVTATPPFDRGRGRTTAPGPDAVDGPEAVRTAAADREEAVERREAAEDSPGMDWTYLRGPFHNGVSYETGLVDDWDPEGGEGSNVLWMREDLGGRSTPIVMNGKLYTILRVDPGTRTEGERVVCLDAATGETIWENRFNVWLSSVPKERVGWSSVVGDPETGNVYALGVNGYFQCIDGETGETIWSYALHEEFGMLSTYGGRTNFPMVYEDMVLVSGVIIGWGDMARPAHRFLAFDKRNGDVRWFNGTGIGPADTTYSAPVMTVSNNQKMMIFGSGDGAVWAFQPRTGKPVWNCRLSIRGLNVSPLAVDDVVYMAHSEENVDSTAMGSLMAIDATGEGDVRDSNILWRIDQLVMGRAAPIKIGDRLYCIDDRARLHVIDRHTGEVLFERIALGDRMHRANPLYADGKLYVVTANGTWHILEPDEEEGIKTLSSGRLPRTEFHAAPIASHGRVYLQSTDALYCLADPDKEAGLDPLPEPSQEPAVEEDSEPAQLQITPAELLMRPGRIASFRARLYNSRGQFLDETPAEFTLDGPGQLGSDGTYLAPSDASQAAAYITAHVDGMESTARVRIIPDLPWKFAFDELDEIPITWVGIRHRHQLRELDDRQVMVKVTTIPLGTTSRGFLGHHDLRDYTIEADVMGQQSQNQLPEIGVIAQGYTMVMLGNQQQLQIRSWDAELRMAETIDFPWDHDTWYTMKLRAKVEDREDEDGSIRPVAVVQGKVWPRDEEEPDEWTLEATDESPNFRGSPGLYGSADVAEIYLDRIEVVPND